MNRKSISSILKQAKSKSDTKKNFTFRLPPELYDSFAQSCENKGTLPTKVVEEFMKNFVSEYPPKRGRGD